MDFQTFQQSLEQDSPPEDLSEFLQALWQDGKGDWQAAHDLVDGSPGSTAAWVHAYLHRKEGDSWNADYWYRKAGKTRPEHNLGQEWEFLVRELLER